LKNDVKLHIEYYRNKFYQFNDETNEGGINKINNYLNKNMQSDNEKVDRPNINIQISTNSEKTDTSVSKPKVEEHRIGTIEEVEEWLIDNQFILTGYRIGYHKFKDVIKTLFI
jgi:uncharacterized coiled-coil DUF342 family protein